MVVQKMFNKFSHKHRCTATVQTQVPSSHAQIANPVGDFQSSVSPRISLLQHRASLSPNVQITAQRTTQSQLLTAEDAAKQAREPQRLKVFYHLK